MDIVCILIAGLKEMTAELQSGSFSFVTGCMIAETSRTLGLVAKQKQDAETL